MINECSVKNTQKYSFFNGKKNPSDFIWSLFNLSFLEFYCWCSTLHSLFFSFWLIRIHKRCFRWINSFYSYLFMLILNSLGYNWYVYECVHECMQHLLLFINTNSNNNKNRQQHVISWTVWNKCTTANTHWTNIYFFKPPVKHHRLCKFAACTTFEAACIFFWRATHQMEILKNAITYMKWIYLYVIVNKYQKSKLKSLYFLCFFRCTIIFVVVAGYAGQCRRIRKRVTNCLLPKMRKCSKQQQQINAIKFIVFCTRFCFYIPSTVIWDHQFSFVIVIIFDNKKQEKFNWMCAVGYLQWHTLFSLFLLFSA